MVVLSPGVSIDSDIVKTAQEKKIEILGEVEFAYRFSKAPIYAITGTNGKTTTTSLLGEMFKKQEEKYMLLGI